MKARLREAKRQKEGSNKNLEGRGEEEKKRLTERQIKENRRSEQTKLRETANETVNSLTNQDQKWRKRVNEQKT